MPSPVATVGGSTNTWGTETNAHFLVHCVPATGVLHNILQNSADTNTILDLGSTVADKVTLKVGNEVFITCLEDGIQDILTIGDGGDIDFKVLSTGSAIGLFVEGSTGKAGVGTATLSSMFQVKDEIGIGDATFTFASFEKLRLHHSSSTQIAMRTAGGGDFLVGERSNGTLASPTIVVDDDLVLTIKGTCYDGGDWANICAEIEFAVDGTPGVNDTPGRIMFSTTPDGSATTTERVRIIADGGVLMYSLKSGATQGAAGAAASELWKTSSHATLPDNVILIGV